MSEEQGRVLRDAVAIRANSLVVGATSSGKTTLVIALLAKVAASSDRVIIA